MFYILGDCVKVINIILYNWAFALETWNHDVTAIQFTMMSPPINFQFIALNAIPKTSQSV